jgi:adenylate kinase
VRLVLLGPPGVGKGTQGRRLAVECRFALISTGEILREAISKGTELGREAQRRMDRGLLVPDEVMIGLVRERTAESDAADGFVLDGFPRTVPQAKALDEILRVDDAEETVLTRLAVYREQTAPLIDYYARDGRLIEVPGVGPMNDVYAALKQVVGCARNAG